MLLPPLYPFSREKVLPIHARGNLPSVLPGEQLASGWDEFMVQTEVFAHVFVFTSLGESGSPVV